VALSGFVQLERAKRDERIEREAMMRSLPIRRLKQIYGDRGVHILKESTQLDGFRIVPLRDFRGTAADWEELSRDSLIVSGHVHDREFASRVAQVLLKGSTYFVVDNVPPPEVGLRFLSDRGSLDVAFSFGSSDQVDVWACVRDEGGKVVHAGRGYGLEHASLRKRIGECVGELGQELRTKTQVPSTNLE
jgi:hypothetical protein